MIDAVLLGPGRVGTMYSQIVTQDERIRLIAVVGSSEEKANEFCKNFTPESRAFGPFGLNEALELLRSKDLVIITSPEWLHTEHLISVLKYDLHIIIEKPLITDFDRLIDVEEGIGKFERFVLPCFTSRFDFRFISAHNALQKMVDQPIHIFSRRNTDRQTASRVLGKFDLAHWIVCHDIDLFRWFLNDEIQSVRASNKSFGGYGSNDFIFAELTMSRGCKCFVESSWVTDSPYAGYPHSEFRVEGELHAINVNLHSPFMHGHRKSVSIDQNVPDPYLIGTKIRGSSFNMLDHFFDVLLGQAPPLVSHNDAVACLKVCNAIAVSIKERRVVELDVEC